MTSLKDYWLQPSITPALFNLVSEWPDMETVRPIRILLQNHPGLAGIVDIASSGDWLLALHSGRRVFALDTTSQKLHDLSPMLAAPGFDAIWPGAHKEFFLGSAPSKVVTRVLLHPRTPDLEVEVSYFSRSQNIMYSLPVNTGYWFSNAPLLKKGLLSIDEFRDGELVSRETVGRVLFPDVPHHLVSVRLNRSIIAAPPRGDRVAQAFKFASRIHIYTASGVLERRVAGPIEVVIRYDEFVNPGTNQTEMRLRPDTKFCYIDVTATNEAIFALFSGRAIGSYPQSLGDQLHVFGWDGRFLGLIRLDSSVREIAASGDQEFIWAYAPAPNARLIEYPISGLRADTEPSRN